MCRKLIYLLAFVVVLGLAGIASAEEGLLGEYYHEASDDTWEDLVMVRLDPTVDFSWGDGSPEPGSSMLTVLRCAGRVRSRYRAPGPGLSTRRQTMESGYL